MSVLITGYKGYIGSHIYDYLISNKYIVYGIDYNKFDIKNYNKLDDFCFNKNIKTIIHLASFNDKEESINEPLKYYDNNISILINILKLIDKYKIKNLIYSSTASILNNDMSLIDIKSSHNPYYKTKIICEEIIEDYYKTNSKCNYTILRYFNVYGFTINKDITPFIRNNNSIFFKIQHYLLINNTKPFQIYGHNYDTNDGTCVRDYIHIEDLVKEHINYIDSNSNNIENVGTGKGMSVLEFVRMYKNVKYIFVNERQNDKDVLIKRNRSYIFFFNIIEVFSRKIYNFIKKT